MTPGEKHRAPPVSAPLAPRISRFQRRSTGLSLHPVSAKRRSHFDGCTFDTPTTIRPISAPNEHSRRAVLSGRRAKPAATLRVDESGLKRRMGPGAVSIQQHVERGG